MAGRLPLDFGLETKIASSSVLSNVPRHVRPPVVSGDEFECLPPSGMSSNVAIVVKGHDLPSDVSSRGNIDLAMEIEYSVHF
jgi:hypothetical protein